MDSGPNQVTLLDQAEPIVKGYELRCCETAIVEQDFDVTVDGPALEGFGTGLGELFTGCEVLEVDALEPEDDDGIEGVAERLLDEAEDLEESVPVEVPRVLLRQLARPSQVWVWYFPAP